MIYKGRELLLGMHIGDFSRLFYISDNKDYSDTMAYIRKKDIEEYVIILTGNQQHVDSYVATDEDPKTLQEMRAIIRTDKKGTLFD